jgi:hypothetical protein
VTFTVLLAAAILIQMPPVGDCDAECERRAALVLIERGETRAAVERLRGAVARFPDAAALSLLLARGYLAEGNLFWAEHTLRDALVRRPADLEARSWLASVHLRQGDPELVRADLDLGLVPEDGPARARWRLLEALRARLAGDAEVARQALLDVPRSARLYPEDRPVWSFLQRRSDPWWLDPVTGTVEVAVGGTSNALAGAPTDPGESGGASALGLVDLRIRLASPVASPLRPILDFEVDGNGLGEEDYRELSSLRGAARLGGLFTWKQRRLLLGYRAEVLLLDQEPSRYAVAHRAEAEVETPSGWVTFAGVGRRSYRDGRRTRWEGDAGIGTPVQLLPSFPLVVGATVRLSDARSPAYDQRGGSVAVLSRFALGRGLAARLALTGSLDDYPHSGGAEGLAAFGTEERRRDLLGRLSLGVWAPPWRGLRAGLEWQLTHRNSTADDAPGLDFDYNEQRVMIRVRWGVAADPWAPRMVDVPDHVPLDWGLEDGEGLGEERILDVLRQDEELRRGSSCVVR